VIVIRVILADDHPIVRQGVRANLQEDPTIEVVAEADSGDAALALLESTPADVWLVDVTMPGLNGIDLTQQLRLSERAPKVIVLSMHTERDFVIPAFQAGANGYLVKSVDPEVLRRAVKAVARGQSYVCAEVADLVLQHSIGGTASAHEALTQRERQVLQLVAEGLNAKEIGATLGISDKTVHAFRGQVMRKLDVHSVAGLTKYAIRHGITTVE
jgi:DNA-binding NarL/FixJ family response regulator